MKKFYLVQNLALSLIGKGLQIFGLLHRDAVIFLVEALVALGACTAGSVSCTKGSSAIASWVEGAAAASFFGSSSSLQEETDFIQPERKKASIAKS
jgi:hypothetical protein